MAPVMAKLVTSMLECYSREEVVADVYCSALESARLELGVASFFCFLKYIYIFEPQAFK